MSGTTQKPSMTVLKYEHALQLFPDRDPTERTVQAAMLMIDAVGEAIQSLGEIPSGPLYAMLMSSGMTLTIYQGIIANLKRIGLVSESNHVLRWVGGAKREKQALCRHVYTSVIDEQSGGIDDHATLQTQCVDCGAYLVETYFATRDEPDMRPMTLAERARYTD